MNTQVQKFDYQNLLDAVDYRLIQRIQTGLPLVSEPYAEVAGELGISEEETLLRIRRLRDCRLFKRFGVIVRHRKLGYRANAMVVWDIPEQQLATIGETLSQQKVVTLCYSRPRRLPDWPYNLFSMIHGHDQLSVREKLDTLIEECGLQAIPHNILFSKRCFKQRGACYMNRNKSELHAHG